MNGKQSLITYQLEHGRMRLHLVIQLCRGTLHLVIRVSTTRLHEQVETDFALLVEAITHRKAAAHEEIESRAEAVLRPIEAEKTSMEDWLSRTGGCMEMSSRALVADCAVPIFTECQVNKRWLGQIRPLQLLFTVYH